jgi:hypothetical protein
MAAEARHSGRQTMPGECPARAYRRQTLREEQSRARPHRHSTGQYATLHDTTRKRQSSGTSPHPAHRRARRRDDFWEKQVEHRSHIRGRLTTSTQHHTVPQRLSLGQAYHDARRNSSSSPVSLRRSDTVHKPAAASDLTTSDAALISLTSIWLLFARLAQIPMASLLVWSPV